MPLDIGLGATRCTPGATVANGPGATCCCGASRCGPGASRCGPGLCGPGASRCGPGADSMQQPGGVTVHASDSDSNDPRQRHRQRHTERPHPQRGNVDRGGVILLDDANSCSELEDGASQGSEAPAAFEPMIESAAAQRWAAAPVTAELAAECDAHVLAALAAAAAAGQAPVWVQAAKAALGEPALGLLGSAGRAGSALQQVSPLSIMHDCRGTAASCPAWRPCAGTGVGCRL